MSQTSSHTRLNYLAGIISIIANALLFALKYWAGLVSGSVALLADAWHTLSDSLSSVAVLIGVKMSSRKADKKHPFGHGRIENLVAILIGVMLAIVAYEFITQAIDKLKNPESKAIFGTLAIVVTSVSIIVKEGMAQFSFYIARKTGNISVKADGWHHRSDALSSIVVLAGIFLQDYFWWIDAVLGICVSVILMVAVYKIIREAVDKLMGERVPDEIIVQVKTVIQETIGGDLQVHHFHIHNYGTHSELTFHINLPPDMTILEGHGIADRIEKQLRERMNIETTIHIEPKKQTE
ncbi:MAG: cation transporter [Bacteroidales bacterium]|nr:cation transporter [Bacteroidales bacterium]